MRQAICVATVMSRPQGRLVVVAAWRFSLALAAVVALPDHNRLATIAQEPTSGLDWAIVPSRAHLRQ